MAISWRWVLILAAKVFGYLLKQASPHIKKALEEQLKALYLKALETENPFDDHAMAMVLEILAIEKPEAPKVELP